MLMLKKYILLAHRLIFTRHFFTITLQYIKPYNDYGVFCGVSHSRKISDAKFFTVGFEDFNMFK